MNSLRKILKKNTVVFSAYIIAKRTRRIFKPRKKIIETLHLTINFYKEFFSYQKHNTNKNFVINTHDMYPCIYDRTDTTKLDYTYFYQDSWCAKKIFENKPEHHYDIGSEAKMIGIISQFTPTTMLDIRPIDVKLPGLFFKKADVLKTGIADNSIKSLSSICVLEHIGLGRYGDKLDYFGTEKSVAEVKRILAHNGNLYISLPVDKENKIYFNAHRSFTRDYILSMFSSLQLVEEKYIYRTRMFDTYDPSKGFGTGLFYFKKTKI